MENQIQVVTDEPTKFEMIVKGEGHTLFNLLRKELFNDPAIDHAGYMIKHPLIKEVRLYVKTKKETTPKEAIKNALKRIEAKIDEFKIKFEEKLSES
ncbi:MAG: RpoL/Rpb11 RNA polymerase subunit family protein [Candidatus Helarchaeota archaeon]